MCGRRLHEVPYEVQCEDPHDGPHEVRMTKAHGEATGPHDVWGRRPHEVPHELPHEVRMTKPQEPHEMRMTKFP